MITSHPYFLIFICIIFNVISQLLLKAGMNGIGYFDYTLSSLISVGLRAAMNPGIALGLLLYGLSFVLWLVVLSRLEVSLAYPLLSIGYIIMPFVSYLFLGETLSLSRVLGISVIIVGVFLVSRS